MRALPTLAGALVMAAAFAVGGGPISAAVAGFAAFVAVHHMQPETQP